MSNYKCSVCEYTSHQKESVIRHTNKKKSCGDGIKEVLTIPIEIKCGYCDKSFSTIVCLNRHIKNTCKFKDYKKQHETIKLLEQEIDDLKKVYR